MDNSPSFSPPASPIPATALCLHLRVRLQGSLFSSFPSFLHPSLPPFNLSFYFFLLLSLPPREKYVLELQSPRYTRLRDWHHQRSAHVLNVQS